MIKKVMTGLLTLMLVLLYWTTPISYAKQDKTIRIGYMDYANFINEKDGNYTGYAVDYLKEISKYTGWNYEYVYGTWEEINQMLDEHKIDFVCSAQKTPKRIESNEFSAYPIGYTQGLLYTRPSNNRLYYEDFIGFDGIRVAELKGNAMNQYFDEYATYHGFSYLSLMFEDNNKMQEALKSGEVDAIVTEQLSYYNNLKLVGEFKTDGYYMMSYLESPYMEDLNYAIGKIKRNPSFEAELYEKYYGTSSAVRSPLFTREESNYIKELQGQDIVVGNLPNSYPMSYYDTDTKQMKGMIEGVLDRISDISGLVFTYQPISEGKQPIQELKESNYDLVAGIAQTNKALSDPEITISKSFLSSNYVVVTQKGYIYDNVKTIKVAVNQSFQFLYENIKDHDVKYSIQYYKNKEQALKAVKDGTSEAMIQNEYIMNYLLQNPRNSDLMILPISFGKELSCIAAKRTTDPRLLSIINKSIAVLTKDDMEQIIMEYTTASPYQATIFDLIYQNKVSFGIICVLFIVLILAVFYMIKIKQMSLKQLSVSNGQLKRAVELADKASMAKSQFLAQISHEIRTPMNAIVGITQIAKTEAEQNCIVDYLNKIENSSKLLLSIINEVLDMSAIEGGKLKISSEVFNLKEMLTNLTTVFYQQAKMKQIQFKIKVSAITTESVIGDELRVSQILMNLLSNAIKFTDQRGQVTFRIFQASQSQDKVYFRFTVMDTGCGMKEEMLNRIFNPFEQESAATARKHGGSGLGLSIAKSLTELMGGSISVTSKYGEGSSFTVDLPFARVDKEPVYKIFSSEILMKTLIVSNDPETMNYYESLVKRIGLPYDWTTTAERALEKIGDAEDAGEPYQLCLMDGRITNDKGVSLLSQIHEIFGADISIIVVLYDLEEKDEMMDTEHIYLVTKPLFQSTLFDVIMKASGKEEIDKMIPEDVIGYNFIGKRVLVAEDVKLNLEVIVKLLELIGVSCTTAENGKEAVDLFKQAEIGWYDCIFMDINMPIMDGYTATKLIRSFSRSDAKSIPIYAMTANAFSEDIKEALNCGMNGHIAKPIETKILYKTLELAFKS